jgi:hypothetical protein
VALLSSNRTGLTWTLMWWLMTYSPLAGALNKLHNFKPVKVSGVCKKEGYIQCCWLWLF